VPTQNGNASAGDRLIVVYERVSDKKQDLARQAVQRERAAADYPGREITVIAEKGSAYKVSVFDRPRGRWLCDLIEAGKVEALFVDEQSRLSRGEDDEWTTFRVLVEANETRVLIDGQEMRHDLGGKVMSYVTALAARQESKDKAHRVSGGLRLRAERGKRQGGPRPFGYKHEVVGFDPVKKKPVTEVVQVPHEAAVVVRIFEWVAEGRPQSEIARALNAEDIKTVNGASWKQTRVSQMTRNPIYIGKLKTKHGVLDGEHEPIVTPELWERVARLREGRGPAQGRGRTPKGKHLLPGTLLRCGLCGAAMVPRTEPTREVYRCSGRHQGHTICDMRPVLREPVDTAVGDYFMRALLDVEATRQQFAEAGSRKQAELDLHIGDAERQLLQVQAAREKVERDYFYGDLPAERRMADLERLDGEEASAQAELDRLRDRHVEVLDLSVLQDAETEVVEALAAIRAALAAGVNSGAGAGVDQLRAELLRLFDSFVIFPSDRTRRLEREREPSEVVATGGHYIELHARPSAIQGFTFMEEDGAEWVAPLIEQVGLSSGETNSASEP
jgi:DNA invertase Pin-like site-specific DNA recombinase